MRPSSGAPVRSHLMRETTAVIHKMIWGVLVKFMQLFISTAVQKLIVNPFKWGHLIFCLSHGQLALSHPIFPRCHESDSFCSVNVRVCVYSVSVQALMRCTVSQPVVGWELSVNQSRRLWSVFKSCPAAVWHLPLLLCSSVSACSICLQITYRTTAPAGLSRVRFMTFSTLWRRWVFLTYFYCFSAFLLVCPRQYKLVLSTATILDDKGHGNIFSTNPQINGLTKKSCKIFTRSSQDLLKWQGHHLGSKHIEGLVRTMGGWSEWTLVQLQHFCQQHKC